MTTSGGTRPVRQSPEPARFWIAFAPRQWRLAGECWTDLANARLGAVRGMPGMALPEIDAGDLDDLFYLPPVARELQSQRDLTAASLLETGVPVLIQLRPGETTSVPGARVVYDLLLPLLDGDVDALADLPAGATAVWPLIGGLTDQIDVWEEGFAVLETAGARTVQAMLLELQAPQKRKLAEGRDDSVFDALFHGEAASEQHFAIRADRHGFAPFMPRDPVGITPRQLRNRKIAAELALIGETWLRLGKATAIGQAFFRAARGAEGTHHDLEALVREENLSLMSWIDGRSLEVIREIVTEDRSTLAEEVLDEYLERPPVADRRHEAGGTGD